MRQASPKHRYNAPVHNIDGQAIYLLRVEAGISLRDLAKTVQWTGTRISRPTINRAELGRPIGRAKLQGIADALTVKLGRPITINDLLTKDLP